MTLCFKLSWDGDNPVTDQRFLQLSKEGTDSNDPEAVREIYRFWATFVYQRSNTNSVFLFGGIFYVLKAKIYVLGYKNDGNLAPMFEEAGGETVIIGGRIIFKFLNFVGHLIWCDNW